MIDVSIIIISYNDAARLPRAVNAALSQTLHNIEVIVVDDASTDETQQVIAAFDDPRLRSVRLEQNSGGCSAPRNAGIDVAQGTWVMFCDSNDALEMHAAKNLLLAVEQADADLGCGVAERVDVHTGKSKRWRADAHAPGVIDDIGERPRLLYDTICVNKMYRRSWLNALQLRFIDDLLYEDQLFTLQCYLRANRIAIIDPTVYLWNVEKLDESITQRRAEERNVHDRVAINQMIDAELVDRPDLRRVKDAKFLSHEVYLYLRTIERLDDDRARALLAPLVAYLQTMDLSEAASVRPALRVALYHLLCDDVAGVRRALRNIAWAAVIDMPIVRRGDRDLWGCPCLADGAAIGGYPAEWWLDITALRASAAPIPQQRPCHVVHELTAHSIRGQTVDAYAVATNLQQVAVLWMSHGDRILGRDVLQWELRDGHIHWYGTIRQPDLRGRRGTLFLEFTFPTATNRTAIRSERAFEGFSAGEFGTVRWRDHRRSLTPGQWLRRRFARPGRSAIVLGQRRPPDRAQSAALSALLARRGVEHLWVQHPGFPAAPPSTRGVDRGSIEHRNLAPVPIPAPLPLALVAAHLQLVDADAVRRDLDITGPIVLALPRGEAAFLDRAEQVHAQVLVQRLDGAAAQTPAALRAWVQDARALSLAEALAVCDLCVTDDPAMRVFVQSLGIPVADQLMTPAEHRTPIGVPPELIAEANAYLDALQGQS